MSFQRAQHFTFRAPISSWVQRRERRPNHAGLCCRRQRRRWSAACADARGSWPPGDRDDDEREVEGSHPGDGRGAGRRRRARCRRDRRGGGQSRAGCDHPRDDGPLGHARLPALRSLVRPDEPAADGGHRAPPRGGQGERRQAVRRPELHRLEQQPRRARGSRRRTIRSIRTRSRSRPRRSPRSSSWSAPSSTRRSRGSSFATAASTGPARRRRSADPPQADVPGHRQRRGHRVVDPRR